MKRVLIVEDKKEARDALGKLVNSIRDDIKVYLAGDSETAYKYTMEHDIHLFLVDIILKPQVIGDVSGIIFAEKIRNIPQYQFTPMIFITSLEDPEMHAYRELHCFGFISKPYPVAQTSELIQKALEFPEGKKKDKIIYFKKDGVFYSKKIEDIIYIKSNMGKMLIKTIDDELEIYYKTCDQVMNELDSDLFVKCNRSTIVNKKYIHNIDSTNKYIHLINDYGILDIGTKVKRKFLKEILHD